MARKPSIWHRKGRGLFTTINRKQIPLGTDREKAEKLFHRMLAELSPVAPGRHSTPKLVDYFLFYCERRNQRGERMSGETLACYKKHLIPWARAHRGIRPEDLRVYHLSAWLDSHNWNPSTCALATRIIKRWSRWVTRQGYIDSDRLSFAEPPQALKRERAVDGDLERFEAAITDSVFLDLFHLLLDTGSRPGEIATLCADRCNLDTCTAVVAGKTGARVIGLTSRAVAILNRRIYEHPSGPLLRTKTGVPWSPRMISYWWSKTRAVAKVEPTLIPYMLRHELPRRWRAAGIEELIIAKQLGHSLRNEPHLGLLNSVYGHVEAPELAAAAGQVSEKAIPEPALPRVARLRNGR